MNKKLLTILGCSSSDALSLVNANSVSAKEYVFTAPEFDNQLAEIPARATDYSFFSQCDRVLRPSLLQQIVAQMTKY